MADNSGDHAWDRVPIDAQSVDAPLSASAIFLVVTVPDSPQAVATVRNTLGEIDDLVKNVAFRDLDARLSCVVGIGSDFWDRLKLPKKPKELKPFAAIKGAAHDAPSTPGDLLFHIRAERHDFCFEFERILLDTLGGAVRLVDEVTGFRYFDARDLLGFVDGTANPVGPDLKKSAQVSREDDPDFAGGAYIVVQKYIHNLGNWKKQSTEAQEAIIGRTKIDNIEIDDDAKRQKSHKSLATITDDAGVEHDILRDNMPFGSAGAGEYGTYFIGYSGKLWVTEKMLERMFIGAPEGLYDRLLDFSEAKTGTTFFAPCRGVLEEISGG